MTKRLTSWFCLTTLTCLTGCLEYEKQTLSFVYDKRLDELRVFQVYERVHMGETVSDDEKRFLARLVQAPWSDFLVHWYMQDELEGYLERVKETKSYQTVESELEYFSTLLGERHHRSHPNGHKTP